MALSGLDIYKLLPKTNCRQCGFATCLAFAMQLAKKAVAIDKCPFISPEAKAALEAQAQPPIKLISIGAGENKIEIGNETVLFRHEEKFRNPCAIGFIIDDTLPGAEIKHRLQKINKLKFERVGQELKVDLVAIRQNSAAAKFAEVVSLVAANTHLGLVLISSDLKALKDALAKIKERRPLVYYTAKDDIAGIAQLAKEFAVPVVVSSADLSALSERVKELNKQGVNELILDTGKGTLTQKVWDLTQIRRQALKKSNRSLGFPVLAIAENDDPFEEAAEAATCISKYAGIVLVKNVAEWQALSLLTLRQNIYTDPQKPLQIEPKLYPVGQVDERSPVLVTTNFSLSYYTVLGEVEASKVPAYIMSVDTEGMSVLTAWAAEKFNAQIIAKNIEKFNVPGVVKHKEIVIPGYLAVMSGDLEEASGWKVVVGPKEAAGIPSFLKNL